MKTHSEYLFAEDSLSRILDIKNEELKAKINQLSLEDFRSVNISDLGNSFIEEFMLIAPTIYADKDHIVSESFEFPVSHNGRVVRNATAYKFFVPFDGDKNLFRYRPSTFSFNPPRATLTCDDICITINLDSNNADRINKEFISELDSISQNLSWVKSDIDKYNNALSGKVSVLLQDRMNKLKTDENILQTMGYQLKRRDNAPSTYRTPAIKRKIFPREKRSRKNVPLEPTIEMEEYNHILSIIKDMTQVIERSPEAFATMSEEDLRQHYLVQLNGHYEGSATGETFNLAGKTDILVCEGDRNLFIAECKIWKGPKSLLNAIDQLLGYTCWRDTKTAIIIFNKNKKLSNVLEAIPETTENHKCFEQKVSFGDETDFRYIFHHRDDELKKLFLTIMVFEMPVTTKSCASSL